MFKESHGKRGNVPKKEIGVLRDKVIYRYEEK